MNIIEVILKSLESSVTLVIVVTILVLAVVDYVFKKDLKSQIVSLGVLGTFIGIFMGLQNFNPDDMKNSIDTILIGLKTAFFTSITGMGVALILSVIQKLSDESSESRNQEILLSNISNKLNYLEKLYLVNVDTQEDRKRDNQFLIEMLESNFIKMNQSLELAIEQLSKGATQEIINALKEVIEEFNQELQTQFGENFVKLNESVINLLKWQDNYKSHIEELEERLNISVSSIEKSKESLELISSKNDEVLGVYRELSKIINTYEQQVLDLNRHLETYSLLSRDAKRLFSTIQETVNLTKNEFIDLSQTIVETNSRQKISFEENKSQLDLISNHFKNMGEEIPNSLGISLEQLNRGLTSLTTQFQKDYKEIMDSYRDGLR